PAVLFGERYAIQRELVVLSFIALIGACGAAALMPVNTRRRRVIASALVLAMVGQFAYFCRDYFGHYQDRAGFSFDPSHFRDLAESAVAADAARRAPAIYVSQQFDDGSVRWRFYVTKLHRVDLLERTRYFEGDGLDLDSAPRFSLMLVAAKGRRLDALLE